MSCLWQPESMCDIKELCNVNMDMWLKKNSVACDIKI